MARSVFYPIVVFLLGFLLISGPFTAAATENESSDEHHASEPEYEVPDESETSDPSDLVSQHVPDEPHIELGPAPWVETIAFFPKNADKSTPAGDEAEVIVGVSNNGAFPLKVAAVTASLHVAYDQRYQIQNFSIVEFGNSAVPPSIQASFPYTFTPSKYLQPGSFALVGSIFYEVEGKPYRSVFYNGTIEISEASGFFSGETLFLVTLGVGMLGLLGMWIYGQFQKLSKKTRRTKKVVETGTRTVEAIDNEWLQGTAFTQKVSKSIAQPTKSKKKK